MADVFGAVLTEDPGFVGRSITEVAEDRHLGRTRPFTHTHAGDLGTPFSDYDPYKLGSVLASALWESGGQIGYPALAALLIRAQKGLAGKITTDFSFAFFLNHVVSHAQGKETLALCDVFRARLALAGKLRCCEATCS
jgi:hypothetical protein